MAPFNKLLVMLATCLVLLTGPIPTCPVSHISLDHTSEWGSSRQTLTAAISETSDLLSTGLQLLFTNMIENPEDMTLALFFTFGYIAHVTHLKSIYPSAKSCVFDHENTNETAEALFTFSLLPKVLNL